MTYAIDINRVEALAAEGMTLWGVAARLGVTECGLRNAVRRSGRQITFGPPRSPERDKVDRDQLRKLVAQGQTTRQIANHFNCTMAAIAIACHRHDIPLPARRASAQIAAPPPSPPPPPPADPSRRGQLVATGGRYAALAAWATRHGTTTPAALAEWHRLRLPLQSKGATP